jgi:hypothetical protein
VQRIQVGVLQAFVNIGGLTVPQLSFFAAFFATTLTAYVVLNFSSLNTHAIGIAVAGTAAFWFETIRVWVKSPPGQDFKTRILKYHYITIISSAIASASRSKWRFAIT